MIECDKDLASWFHERFDGVRRVDRTPSKGRHLHEGEELGYRVHSGAYQLCQQCDFGVTRFRRFGGTSLVRALMHEVLHAGRG